MDPIAIVMTALTSGAAASLKDTASIAVKEAYAGLKELIKQKFAGKPVAEVALAEHEKKPDVWKAPLEEALKERQIDQDQAIIAAAQKVMAQVEPQQAAIGKYNVAIAGNVQGLAQGDNQQVTMHFDSTPDKK